MRSFSWHGSISTNPDVSLRGSKPGRPGDVGFRRRLPPEAWPLLLVVVVLALPSASVLWFMNEALDNADLAARQRIAELYQHQVSAAQRRFERAWRERLAALEEVVRTSPNGAAAFEVVVSSALADSIVLQGDTAEATYPGLPEAPRAPVDPDPRWEAARTWEQSGTNVMAAAVMYERIASESSRPGEVARALQAQLRCLVQGRQFTAAIRLVEGPMQDHAGVVDEQGRSMLPNAELLAMELSRQTGDPAFQPLADRLRARLVDYRSGNLPGHQRRFLMLEWERLTGDASAFPTLEAERLAQRFVDQSDPPAPAETLRPVEGGELWQWRPASGTLIGLFRQDTLRRWFGKAGDESALPEEARVELMPPESADERALASLPAGDAFPGWRIVAQALPGHDGSLIVRGASHPYVWIAIVVNGSFIVGALLVGGWMRRKMRLARVEQDLAATVSHELKTPLASMRVLVDTLLEAPTSDPAQVREYLQLIERENTRLSRLIDNFLAFARLESRSPAWHFEDLPAGEIARRLQSALPPPRADQCPRVRLEAAPDLPRIRAHPDALVSALLNLADNACKFSGEAPEVVIRASATNGHVRFDVEDHGPGIPRPLLKKVFRRYYQVEPGAGGSKGGCGLGLNIVQRIVEAHQGRVEVRSVVGQGSTFSVVLPALRATPPPA